MNTKELLIEALSKTTYLTIDASISRVSALRKIPSNEMDLHYNMAILDVLTEFQRMKENLSIEDIKAIVGSVLL